MDNDSNVHIAAMQEQIKTLFATLQEAKNTIREMAEDIKKLVAGRPTWATATIIALLASAVSAETVALFSKFGH